MVVMILLTTLLLPFWPIVGKETIKVTALYMFCNLITVGIVTLLTRCRSVFAMLYLPMSVLVRGLLAYILARGLIPVRSENDCS